MKLIGGKHPAYYVGLHAVCQFCGQHVVFEEGDVKQAAAGDFKDEGSYRWKCPTCGGNTTVGPSRLKQESDNIMRKRH